METIHRIIHIIDRLVIIHLISHVSNKNYTLILHVEHQCYMFICYCYTTLFLVVIVTHDNTTQFPDDFAEWQQFCVCCL